MQTHLYCLCSLVLPATGEGGLCDCSSGVTAERPEDFVLVDHRVHSPWEIVPFFAYSLYAIMATPLVLKKDYVLDILTNWQITLPNEEKTTEIGRAGSHSSSPSANDRSTRTAVLKQENNWSEMVVVATVLFKQVRNSVWKL